MLLKSENVSLKFSWVFLGWKHILYRNFNFKLNTLYFSNSNFFQLQFPHFNITDDFKNLFFSDGQFVARQLVDLWPRPESSSEVCVAFDGLALKVPWVVRDRSPVSPHRRRSSSTSRSTLHRNHGKSDENEMQRKKTNPVRLR